MDIIGTISRLSAISGPSGHEKAVAAEASEMLKPLVDCVETDRFGNVMGILKGADDRSPRIVLDAHLDEVGLVITGQNDGFLRFRTLGGVDSRILPAREVVIVSDEDIFGVIMATPPHLLEKGQEDKAVKIKDMLIDVGMNETEAARLIGRPAVCFDRPRPLGSRQFSGKALDDRLGFAVLLRTLELLSQWYFERKIEVIVLASVQEEVGCRGAAAAVDRLAPDYFIAVDVTHGRTPDVSSDKTFELGGGPAIGIGPNINRKMSDKLASLAREKGIRYQLEVMEGNTGTNAWPAQTAGTGVATALVSVPLKYMHAQGRQP
ncbi:hypothetical protein FACS1894171_2840 [Clostridia bacterium]|nr:hypothetical protein FACS1894171_2840 [Clostridia bacterium]